MEASTARADEAAAPLAELLGPHLEALFWQPERLLVDSAWYGHLPFAHWIVAAARPRLLVELGTHAGLSYAAFCNAVQRARLDTRCVAIDTWQGDEHAGFYGEEVFADLAAFHDARYGGFSRLLRMTFDAALDRLDGSSIDLLHIDGRHSYDDVRHDFESWRPKLSPRGVVLLHDTAIRERGFGVGRLWAELTPLLPHFEFRHASGLGVLCVGAQAPEPVRALCALHDDPAAAEQMRACFASLGERWVLARAERRLEEALAQQRRHSAGLEASFAELGGKFAELEGKFAELMAYTTVLQQHQR